MARSSGGGSRSGGSHGGRSRSSLRNSSRHGGSGYLDFKYKWSRNPKPGYTRFILHNKLRKCASFIYCNYNPAYNRKIKFTSGDIVILFVFLLFLLCSVWLLVMSVYVPKPLSKTENPHDQIVIIDNIDVIDNEIILAEKLSYFYEKTGVTPAVITVPHSDWQNHYRSLEDYAMELYYAHFDDECHWLIVYSEPIDQEFNDWHWEGIIGDDTIKVISHRVCNEMTIKMQHSLYNDSLEETIINVFTYIIDNDLDIYIDYMTIVGAVILAVFIIFCLRLCLRVELGPRRFKNAMYADDSVRLIKCDYCGGIYGTNVQYSCPYCDSPLTVPTVYYDDYIKY